MNLMDTHTHLYLKHFKQDREKVIRKAITNGVDKMLLPNINSSTIKAMNKICADFPKNCFAMIGLHPCDVKHETYKKELKIVEDELKTGNYIAIGEIGLDLYWEKRTLEIQKDTFEFQINLAKNHKLPIAIHVRESFKEAIEIVEKLNDKDLSGVFHCFTGSINDAKRIIGLGNFYLGIGGVLTFKNSGLDKTIEQIDLKHLILETDSPYLAPTPFRGKRNESKYIVHVAEKLAEVKGVSLEAIAEITSRNASTLFKIP
jgi:TatD DNase family protein|tara:strand:- start:314 stop:1090 length:777 start_codon:yes stop_codon:yes gene_type:complete